MKHLKTVFAMFALTVMLLPLTTSAQQQKRVLIEQYTGAWCGWCPDGSIIMDQIIDENPETVIGIKIHSGDDMEFPGVDTLTSFVSGYPSGSIDRVNWPGQGIAINRTVWVARTNERLATEAKAFIKIDNVTFDPETRIVTANVSGQVLQAISGDVRVNLYLVEDSVSGTGAGYDQRNFFRNNPNFVGHPYYSKADPIVGYQHRNVVRQLVDGAWGRAGVVPVNPSAGTSFQTSFTSFVSPMWRPDRMFVVAVITKQGATVQDREIFNVDDADLTNLPAANVSVTPELTTSSSFYVTRGGATERTVRIRNSGNTAVEVAMMMDRTVGIVPAGYSYTFTPSKVSVPANGNAEVKLTINSTEASIYTNFRIAAVPIVPGAVTVGRALALETLTEGTRFVSYANGINLSAWAYSWVTNQAPLANDVAFVPLTPSTLQAFPSKDFEVVVADAGFSPLDATGTTFAPYVNIMQDALANGRRAVVCSPFGLTRTFSTNTNYSQTAWRTAKARRFFNDTLGIDYSREELRISTNAQGQITAFNSFQIAGVSSNDTWKDWTAEGNATPNLQGAQVTDVMSIRPNSAAKGLFFYDDDDSALGGIEFEKNGARLTFLTLPVEAFQGNTGQIVRYLDNFMNKTFGGLTSAEENTTVVSASISPNPVVGTSTLSVSTDLAQTGLVSVEIVNTMGEVVQSIELPAGTASVEINQANLNSGAYTAFIRAGADSRSVPFVVVK